MRLTSGLAHGCGQVPLTAVFGRPIDVEKVEEPTEARSFSSFSLLFPHFPSFSLLVPPPPSASDLTSAHSQIPIHSQIDRTNEPASQRLFCSLSACARTATLN